MSDELNIQRTLGEILTTVRMLTEDNKDIKQKLDKILQTGCETGARIEKELKEDIKELKERPDKTLDRARSYATIASTIAGVIGTALGWFINKLTGG